MQKCDLKFIEITFLDGYSSVNMLYEHFWRTASAFCSKYRDYKCRGSLIEVGKNPFEIHFSIINTFSNFIYWLSLGGQRLDFRSNSGC